MEVGFRASQAVSKGNPSYFSLAMGLSLTFNELATNVLRDGGGGGVQCSLSPAVALLSRVFLQDPLEVRVRVRIRIRIGVIGLGLEF